MAVFWRDVDKAWPCRTACPPVCKPLCRAGQGKMGSEEGLGCTELFLCHSTVLYTQVQEFSIQSWSSRVLWKYVCQSRREIDMKTFYSSIYESDTKTLYYLCRPMVYGPPLGHLLFRIFEGLDGPEAKPHKGWADLCPELPWTYVYMSLILLHFFSFSWIHMHILYNDNCPEAYLSSYFTFISF